MTKFPIAALFAGLVAGVVLLAGTNRPASADTIGINDVTLDIYFSGSNSPYGHDGDATLTLNAGLAVDNLQFIGYELKSPSACLVQSASALVGVSSYQPDWTILSTGAGNLHLVDGNWIGAAPGTDIAEGTNPIANDPFAGALSYNSGVGDGLGGNVFALGPIVNTSLLTQPAAPSASDMVLDWIAIDSAGHLHTVSGGEIVYHTEPPPVVPEPSLLVLLGSGGLGLVAYAWRRTRIRGR